MKDKEIIYRVWDSGERIYSDELRRLAGLAQDPKLKERLLDMAHWRWKEENCDEDYD